MKQIKLDKILKGCFWATALASAFILTLCISNIPGRLARFGGNPVASSGRMFYASKLVPPIVTKPVRTVTLVVAASNSSARSKAQADYICDGTSDEVEIQAAIDALPAGGGEVQLLEGIFIITDDILPTDYCILSGTGWGTIIRQSTAVTHSAIRTINKQYVIIRDLKVEAQGLGLYHGIFLDDDSSYCIVENCWVDEGKDDDIAIGGSFHRIINNLCTGTGTATSSGIEGEAGSHDIIVQGNTVVGLPAGIDWNAGAEESRFYNIVICDNIVSNIASGGLIKYGIGLTLGTAEDINSIVANNIITGGTEEAELNGIFLSKVKDVTVQGNTISNFTKHGISLYTECENIRIIGNSIYDCDNYGISCDPSSDYVSIIGNIICACGLSGIYSSDTSQNISIIGNTVSACEEHGIYSKSPRTLVSTNRSYGNSQKTDNSYHGISVWGDDSQVVHNHVRHLGGANQHKYGIRVSSTPVRCSVQQNNLVGSGKSGGLSYDPGVIVDAYDNHYDHFQDCLAASANYVHAAIAGTGAEQEITTAITNSDVPRNISITTTNVSTPSGDVTITGIDAKGNSTTENITIVAGGNAYGNKAFSTVSKITIPAGVTSDDTIAVGMSDKLGLSNVIYATGDVYKVKKNNADYPAASYMVNATYDTVDVSTGGAITGGDDFTVYYRSNLNIIS
ncbi:MAG: right-handed parallel beta-helix repeat-containing protein [Desulfobacterales bacterium]|nr:right-handed parallel beta-helix repeat-containing protein [Desulfobacterales bacterium]